MREFLLDLWDESSILPCLTFGLNFLLFSQITSVRTCYWTEKSRNMLQTTSNW